MQLETTVTMDEVTPGLKAALSASLPEPDSGKVRLPLRASCEQRERVHCVDERIAGGVLCSWR
jgi:hypothetical protein